MATRRGFLKTCAGIAAAFSGTSAGSLATAKEERVPEKKQQKTAEPQDQRPPLCLHLLVRFELTNLSSRPLDDVRLSAYANIEAAHTHGDD